MYFLKTEAQFEALGKQLFLTFIYSHKISAETHFLNNQGIFHQSKSECRATKALKWCCAVNTVCSICYIYRVKIDTKVVPLTVTLYALHTSKLAENYVSVCRIGDKAK